MRSICFADINECWNDCACTGDDICENVPGSYICRPPTPGIMLLFYSKRNFKIIVIYIIQCYVYRRCKKYILRFCVSKIVRKMTVKVKFYMYVSNR